MTDFWKVPEPCLFFRWPTSGAMVPLGLVIPAWIGIYIYIYIYTYPFLSTHQKRIRNWGLHHLGEGTHCRPGAALLVYATIGGMVILPKMSKKNTIFPSWNRLGTGEVPESILIVWCCTAKSGEKTISCLAWSNSNKHVEEVYMRCSVHALF